MSIKDTIRFIDNYDNNIAHIHLENKCYISESSIESFMEKSEIQSRDTILKYLKEDYNFNNITIINEYSDIGNTLTLLEVVNAGEIENINELNQLFGFMFDKAIAGISKRDFNDVKELDARMAKCDRLIDDLKEELVNIEKRKEDKTEISNYKFIGLFISRLLNEIVFNVLKPLLLTETLGPLAILITGAKITYSFINLAISLANYKSFIKINIAKMTRIKALLNTQKEAIINKQKHDKENKNNENKK